MPLLSTLRLCICATYYPFGGTFTEKVSHLVTLNAVLLEFNILLVFLIDTTRSIDVVCDKLCRNRRCYRRLCLDSSCPVVPFLVFILIFLNSGHHLTPCTIDTHQKNEDPYTRMHNLEGFSFSRDN
jgi:hypothetical protein